MASDVYGSTDTLSSTTSSEASENYSPRTKVFRRTKVIHNVNVANISGNFAYASRSAKIQVPRGENSVNATSPQTETLTGVGDAEYDREQIHGSYCVYRRHSEPLFEDEKAPWKARARKGIVINKRDEEFDWSIESFFQDLDLFIQEMNKTGDIVKKQRERFILEVVLPHLETSWDKSVSGKGEVYKNLAKISRSVNSGNVVKNSLNLLLHLICRDNFDRGAEGLLIVEKVMRSSIFSQNGMFKNDEHGEQNLKLFVYSRILSLLLLQQERAVTLPIDDLKKVQEVIKQRRKEVKKKDRFRYSLEIIINTISYLLKQHDNTITGTIVKGLEECQQFCKNSNTQARNLQILQTLGSGVDLHYILIHLYGKVHSERPVPQLESERLAMKLIRLIVEDYFNRDGGAQERWKFCLLASSILADITQNNVTKELRTEAGGCLANILRNEKVQKKPECRLLVEQMCSEVFFCPDNETRTFLLHFSNKNKNLEDSLPADQQTKQLCLAYRTQRLEINGTTISKKTDSFVNHGEFQGKKVAIKVLNVKKKHLLEDNPKFEARERLIQEAYNMRRLNASKHSNFPVVLAYDTQSLPYHLITEFERYGNLLKFVQNAREDHRLTLRSNQLLLMLKDITDALLHLEKLGLVHRATMAENVLVGDNYVCKLSGLHAMKKLTGLDTLDDYCSADLPDFISSSNDDDLPIRWKAPECLTRGCYSTASDVWAFGVLAYEVLTFGCTPYRNLSKDEDVRNRVVEFKEIVQREDCFQDKEFELIKQCCKWQMTKRLKLSKVRERLEEMIHLTGNIEARSYLPPLGMQQVARESSDSDWEEIYDFITDVSEDFRDYDSMSFDEINDTHETFAADPGKEYIQGFNRLVPEHVEHVEKLRSLKHFNLAPVLEVMRHDSLEGPSCNLKEYVLNRRCNPKDIVTYLSQVASALHYLHFNHILHGDLRAQHVDVIEPNKVKVGHLDRSKYLSMNAYEATSTTCVVEDTPPTDAIRWSAPEVISDGRFTHASDVWAFGVLAWELYESFRTGQENRELSVPYYSLDNNEILHHMTDKGPMKQPECCPDWVYILMHQCWAFESVQRPPFLAIFDCLTSREPMKSWMMKCWLQTHCESEWPDLNVCQKEDSSHVLPETLHPSPKNIEKMCSDEYFGKHTYRYDETVKGYVEENESLYTYARCEVTANSLEDISGYLCPKESCVDAFKSKKRQSESGEAFNFLKTKRGTVSSKSRKAEDDIQEDREYENMQQNEKTIPYDPPPDKEHWDYQNMPLNVAQNHEYESMEQHHGFSRDFPRQYDQEDKENKDCQAPTALEDDPPTIDKRKRNAPCFKAKRLFKWQPEQKEHVYENRNTFNHVTAQLGAF